jgi:hypothetical protein
MIEAFLRNMAFRVLGTLIEAIRDTEDRHLFIERLAGDWCQDRTQPGMSLGRRSTHGDPNDRASG